MDLSHKLPINLKLSISRNFKKSPKIHGIEVEFSIFYMEILIFHALLEFLYLSEIMKKIEHGS